jgi:hypoxanthine phosphoribosyltransferase
MVTVMKSRSSPARTAAQAPRALSRGEGQALLRARLRAARLPLRAAQGELNADPLDGRIGDVYLGSAEIAARVRGLGAEIAGDYADREPVLVGLLKACVPFVADLSRAIAIPHALDFVSLAGYGGAETGGHERIRFLKDLDMRVGGRDVIVVDEVVDTGLTLPYLTRSLALRGPASLAAVPRPRRRLRRLLPISYVDTVPDEFFAGYGFDVDERWRNLRPVPGARARA